MFNELLLASGVKRGSEVAQVGIDSAGTMVWAILKSVSASITSTEQATIISDASRQKRVPRNASSWKRSLLRQQ